MALPVVQISNKSPSPSFPREGDECKTTGLTDHLVDEDLIDPIKNAPVRKLPLTPVVGILKILKFCFNLPPSRLISPYSGI
jgi:hypothetical protein